MEIVNLASAVLPTSSPAMSAEPKPGASFGQVLQSTKAPPGPEPPQNNTGSGEKEQKTQEPNAQSKTPDLSSKDSQANGPLAAALNFLPVAPWLANFFGPQRLGEKMLASAGNVGALSASATTAAATIAGDKDQVSLSALPQAPQAQIVFAKSDGDAKAGLQAVPTGTPGSTQSLTQIDNAIPQEAAVPTPDSSAPPVPEPANAAVRDIALASTPVSDKPQTAHAPATQNTSSFQNAAQVSSAGAFAGHFGGGNSQPEQQAQQGNPDPAAVIDAVKTIASHVDKLAAAKAVENVTVHLQSEDNSNVVLTVKAVHGQVQAQIVTDNGGLNSALHQNRSQLAHTLQAKGMTLGDVSVGLKNSSGDRQQFSPAVRQLTAARVASTSAPANHAFRKPTGVDLSV